MQNKSSNKLLFVSVVVAISFAVALRSLGQDPSSSTNKNQTEPKQTPSLQQQPAPAAAPQDFSKNTWELPPDADKTKNPVATSDESVAKGKDLYLSKTKGNCVFCHGESGSGNAENLPRLRRKPADLSEKQRLDKMTDGEIFWKASKGINGIMPAGEKRMTEEERWHVVNFVRTLGKEPAINEEQ